MMNTIYICATKYHILITLLKIDLKNKINLFAPRTNEFDGIIINLKRASIG